MKSKYHLKGKKRHAGKHEKHPKGGHKTWLRTRHRMRKAISR